MQIKGVYPRPIDIFAIIGVFLVSTLLATVLATLATTIFSSFSATELDKTLVQGPILFFSYLFSMGVTIAYALLLRRRRLGKGSHVQFYFHKFSPLMLLWGIILLLATTVASEPLVNLFPDALSEMFDLLSNNSWMLFTSVLAAPVLEEVLFRGILQTDLTRKYGATRGILLSALIFGVIHVNPAQVVGAFAVGLVLGFVYHQTRSLWVVIFMHFFNNLLAQVLYMFFGKEAVSMGLNDLVSLPWLYYTLYGLSCLLLLYTIVRIMRLKGAGLVPLEQEAATPSKVSATPENIEASQNKEPQ